MAYEPVSQAELVKYHGARPGVVALRDIILFLWHASGVTDVGIYNRRQVRGGGAWSLHAVGRAVDIGVPSTGVGTLIAAAIQSHAAALGLCEIISNRRRWTAETGWQPYGGVDPHTGHIHIGMTRAMADNGPHDALVAIFAKVLTS